MRRWLVAAVLSAVIVLALAPVSVSAHPLLNTAVLLKIGESEVNATVEVPMSELAAAMGREVTAGDGAVINAYLLRNFKPASPQGQPWQLRFGPGHVKDGRVIKTGAAYKKWVVNVRMAPPRGASVRVFDLGYTAVADKVHDHLILVSIAEDWASGITTATAASPTRLAVIAYNNDLKRVEDVRVDVSRSNWLTGLAAMVKLGMEHIREGTDHLLFLLTLLLPATLLIVRRRWGRFAGWRLTLRHILSITTAFTIGHSITLIFSTLTSIRIPAGPIEALIAVSIIVSAIHAVRPIMAGREVWIAGIFGLVHGMAFSYTLAELNISGSQLALSLLGFNIGIELMQLIIILLVMPSLIILAQAPVYVWVRLAGAVLAFVAAIGWLAARIGHDNPVSQLADSLSSQAYWPVIALAAAAVIVLLRNYHGRQAEDSGPPAVY